MSSYVQEVQRRRTFAIISHPDAGKTTLTEKLLLFGGAIQEAGQVKARGERRRARSDWMKVERERGISVTASVMTFEYDGMVLNLLDTPGHADFSEDTFRTLTAVDSAVMVLDAAKGIEAQTLKLFEVCRLRNVPIITFINKMDRDGLDTFSLLDQIAEQLALDVTPASWPVGMGQDFLGCFDLFADRMLFMERGHAGVAEDGESCQGVDDPKLDRLLPTKAAAQLREEVEMVRGLCSSFDLDSYLEGHMTPVFFGSAINNFGVRELLRGIIDLAPAPRAQQAAERLVTPEEEKVAGFVFKIQANMDPNHRDRIAFLRLVSGHFRRGMKLRHSVSGKILAVHNPLLFMARERGLAEEAWAGDVIGIPNHGVLRIGDTLTEGEALKFTGVPSFAPELLRRVRPEDPMRVKHLENALRQLGEEGAARAFKTLLGSQWIVGVLGALQFEILADRIRTEYDVPVRFEDAGYLTARWLESDDPRLLKRCVDASQAEMAEDYDGAPVFLARNAWRLEDAIKEWSGIRFMKVREGTT
ncbi:MAG: peptide chain release factor 3 [Magnetococcales bacterium]|nr:peptide chain release factor 3 [Magnetococcales bacterium]MBF0439773.1 peptide chain release factor 3 [Magnetococcales bacterium]